MRIVQNNLFLHRTDRIWCNFKLFQTSVSEYQLRYYFFILLCITSLFFSIRKTLVEIIERFIPGIYHQILEHLPICQATNEFWNLRSLVVFNNAFIKPIFVCYSIRSSTRNETNDDLINQLLVNTAGREIFPSKIFLRFKWLILQLVGDHCQNLVLHSGFL